MYLVETPEQLELRQELRAYFARLLSADVRRGLEGGRDTGTFRRVIRQLGHDGWLGIGWPTEYGGQGRPASEQYIFFDEAQRANAPLPFVTLNTVGPTLIRLGTDEQKQRLLPGILRGEVNFAIGYTEAEAGTDLASLRTRAVRAGDEYIVNGAKVFTSGADTADYIWLACRTDPEAPKHKGISILLVPTDSPGFSWTPIMTVGGLQTTATFYDDVRVPAANLVGAENGGWSLITTQLNHERVGLAAVGGLAPRLWEDVSSWARTTPANAGTLGDHAMMIDLPWVQADLAYSHALLVAMRLLNWRMVEATHAGTLGPGESSAVKVYSTEAVIEVYDVLLAMIGAAGTLRAGSPGEVLRGELERAVRHSIVNTFGGGVNEVQREIVASAGLGMKRQARVKPA